MARETGRFYMNKIFGRGMENARAFEEEMHKAGMPEAILRATIEPGRGNGEHRVMIERQTTVPGQGPKANAAGESEHTFNQIEDAIGFVDDMLHGRLPGAGMMANGDGESGEGNDGIPS